MLTRQVEISEKKTHAREQELLSLRSKLAEVHHPPPLNNPNNPNHPQ